MVHEPGRNLHSSTSSFPAHQGRKGSELGGKAYLKVVVICLSASYDLSLRKPKLGSRWQALSVPGTKERAPSNI